MQVAFLTSQGQQDNKLFDITAARDSCLERFVVLKKMLSQNEIKCDTYDMCDIKCIDILICTDIATQLASLLKIIKANSAVHILYMPTEPPVISPLHENSILAIMPFDCVLFWNDDLVEKYGHIQKCNIGQPVLSIASIPDISFDDKGFLAAIYSNKLLHHEYGLYEERISVFEFFANKIEGFDLYGIGWDRSILPFIRSIYKGECKAKKDVLKHYRFSICFENTASYPGLITEKIFDCFAAGTVPIYYGAPNIEEYIPRSCFIDFRDFSNYQSLYDFLVQMTEPEYQEYLNATRNFLNNPLYNEFTSRRYAEIVFKQIFLFNNEAIPTRNILSYKWDLVKVILINPLFFLNNLKKCRRFFFELIFTF
jgi:hypothetical protein